MGCCVSENTFAKAVAAQSAGALDEAEIRMASALLDLGDGTGRRGMWKHQTRRTGLCPKKSFPCRKICHITLKAPGKASPEEAPKENRWS